jgi:SAM-dependent methyltransferase
MLNEFKRVLKPNGKLFLSTPNRIINSPLGIITNPFHTQEWNYNELKIILNNHFSNYKIFGQHYRRFDKSKGTVFWVEKLLYKKGIRKLPIKLQDRIMSLLGKQQLYPLADDFIFVENIDSIEKCKTFYAICRK